MLQHVPDAIFIGPRYTWGSIYGSESLSQTNYTFGMLYKLYKL